MRKWFETLSVAFAVLLGAGTVYAQNAQISGTLKDQSGGVLPGVSVTAKNDATGLTRSTVTEADGQYRVAALPPGEYSLRAELSGFGIEERHAIVLVIDQNAIIDFVLKPAASARPSRCSGETPIVDTTKSDVSTAVSTRRSRTCRSRPGGGSISRC